jgi:hypothetical protein
MQYLRKFIASFLVVAKPLHAIKMGSESFQWVKNQCKAFDEIKRNTNQAPVLALPKWHKPFKVETMQVGMPWE